MSTPEATVPDSVTRELYDALMIARDYVLAEHAEGVAGRGFLAAIETTKHLERIDAALAEAGEYTGRN